MKALAGVAILLLGLVPRWAEAAGGRRDLLAIGHNLGLPHEPALAHAVTDAQRVAALFGALGGADSGRTRVLTNPRKAEVLQVLAAMAARDSGADDVFVYFSGHGDEEAIHLGPERLPLAELRLAVAVLRTPLKVVIVDACRGAGFRKKGLPAGQPFEIDLPATAGSHRGLVTLLAASAGEMAHESRQLGGGVFTHYLLSALRGAADCDGDRRVTLHEAYEFIYGHALARSMAAGIPQRPELTQDSAGQGTAGGHRARPGQRPPGDPRGRRHRLLRLRKRLARPVRRDARAIRPADDPVAPGGPLRRAPAARRCRARGGGHPGLRRRGAPARRHLRVGAIRGPVHARRTGRDHPHQLALSAGASVDNVQAIGPACTAWYAHARGDWLVRAGLTLATIDRHTPFNEVTDRHLDLAAGLGRQWIGRRLTLHALVDLAVRLTDQQTHDHRIRDAPPAWTPTPRRDHALSPALGGTLALTLPLTPRHALLAETTLRTVALRQAHPDRPPHVTLHPTLTLTAGVATNF